MKFHSKSFLVFTDPTADAWDHGRWWPTITTRERLAPMRWRFTLSQAPLPTYAAKRWLLWDNTRYDNRNILIEGNAFENYGAKGGVGISGKQGTAVLIRNTDGVIIRNNKFGPPAPTAPRDARPLIIEASRGVVVKDNQGISNDER